MHKLSLCANERFLMNSKKIATGTLQTTMYAIEHTNHCVLLTLLVILGHLTPPPFANLLPGFRLWQSVPHALPRHRTYERVDAIQP